MCLCQFFVLYIKYFFSFLGFITNGKLRIKIFLGLNLDHDETFSEQMNFNRWPEMRKKLTEVISSRNLSEFSHLFHDDDSCVMPVLTPKEASENPHNKFVFVVRIFVL